MEVTIENRITPLHTRYINLQIDDGCNIRLTSVTVTATATDGKGGEASQSQTIYFIGNRPPTINSFTHSPTGDYFPVGTQVTFTAAASNPDWENLTITYNPSQIITLNQPGSVTVTATVSDGNGGEDSQSQIVHGFEIEIYSTTTPSPQNSFISTDQVSFAARVNGVSGYDNQIDWIGEDNPGGIDSGSLSPAILINGSQYSASPDPPPFPGCPDGRDVVLSYDVIASLEINGHLAADTVTITQDEIDQCRQEYIDHGTNLTPIRSK